MQARTGALQRFSGLRAKPQPCVQRSSLCPRQQRGSMATQAQGAQTQQAQDTRQKYTLKQAAGKSRYEIGPGQRVETATAGVQAFVRLGSAAFVSGNIASFRKRPQQPIELYEFEACPFCRKVREACTILDIDVKFYPCPKDGPTFRPKAIQMSGKSQFPFMVDPNNGNKQLLESDAIIKYLVEEYGDGRVPWQLNLGPLTSISCGFAMLPRVGRGAQYRKSRIPDKPIELWAYEASPFCKLTRERLVELEIPHIYHTVARNSPKRQALIDKWGVFQVPYIEDPNTGVAMFETPKINEYLEATYAV